MELLGISFGLECCEKITDTKDAVNQKVWGQPIYIFSCQ